MAELMAGLKYLWIEHGDTGATVLFLVVLAILGIRALAKGGKGNA